MKSNNNTPAIRFAGFTGDWRCRTLGEMGKARSGVGFPDSEQGGKQGIPFFKVSDMNNIGNATEMCFANNYVTKEQIDSHHWDPIKDLPAIFFAKVGAAVLQNRKRLCTSPFLMDNNTMAYSLDASVWDANFSRALFDTIDLTALIQVGALPSYNAKDVGAVAVFLPEKAEQRQLGHFYDSLEALITLHQKKYEKLVNLKKAMLDKMFPKNGELVPEVRFAGFSGNWERRKLGELVEFKRGLTYAPSDVVTYGIRVLRSSNIDGDTFVLSDADVFVRPSAVNIPFVKKGDILITAANGSSNLVGKHAVIDYTTGEMVHGGFMILAHPHKHSSYVNALISTPWYAEFIQTYIAGGNGAIGNLKMSDLSVQTVCVCSDKEQEKIGEYFANLNGYITLQHQKLEWLQKLKSAFLEKMFV